MGKTAVIDAGLEGIIDTGRHLKPSVCIESFFETADLICLLNRGGKTLETGKIFGAKVAARLKDPEKKPPWFRSKALAVPVESLFPP